MTVVFVAFTSLLYQVSPIWCQFQFSQSFQVFWFPGSWPGSQLSPRLTSCKHQLISISLAWEPTQSLTDLVQAPTHFLTDLARDPTPYWKQDHEICDNCPIMYNRAIFHSDKVRSYKLQVELSLHSLLWNGVSVQKWTDKHLVPSLALSTNLVLGFCYPVLVGDRDWEISFLPFVFS